MPTIDNVYQLRLRPDSDYLPWGFSADPEVVDEIFMTFDTRYCMPGHPFSIMREGIVFVTEPKGFDFDDESNCWVHVYRQEPDDE